METIKIFRNSPNTILVSRNDGIIGRIEVFAPDHYELHSGFHSGFPYGKEFRTEAAAVIEIIKLHLAAWSPNTKIGAVNFKPTHFEPQGPPRSKP